MDVATTSNALIAPGAEGRAGMIAILDEKDTFDPSVMVKDLQKALPAYARPVFVRKVRVMDTTGE